VSTAVAGATATAAAPGATATTAPAAASITPQAASLTLGYVTGTAATAGVLAAVQATAKGFGWTVQSDSSGADGLTKLAQAGAQVIVADGADLDSATRAAAAAFPNIYFVGLGQAGQGDTPGAGVPNLLNLGAGPSREDQLGFMAGVVAGYATQAKVVTAVGYTTDATGLKYRNGFLHGVRLSCSRCRVDFVDLTDLSDGATAAAKAKLNASLSSDVVFAAAGAASADALRAAAGAGAWVAGADTDIYTTVFGGGATEGADKVLASAYFDPGAALAAALKAYQAGKPWSGPMPYSAAAGALVLAPFRVSTDVLSDLDRSDSMAALAQLADGSLDTGIDLSTGNEL
jgi:basic membrane lipoprotein Med (substrate-binding protein (PBP1-ABC) superfamily)